MVLGLGVGVGAGFFYLRDDADPTGVAAASSTSALVETSVTTAVAASTTVLVAEPTTAPPTTTTAPVELPPTINSDVDGPDLSVLALAFDRYVAGINTGVYDQAFLVLSPRMRENITSDGFAEGNSTSLITNFVIRSIDVVDTDTRQVLITMTSQQDPEWGFENQTCTNWTIGYRMIRIDADWHIDRAKNANTPTSC